MMMSFYVKSLFTNVPLKEAVEVVLTMLEEDNFLDSRTVLTLKRIAELLTLCLYRFKEALHIQTTSGHSN